MMTRCAFALFVLVLAAGTSHAWNNKYNASPHAIGFGHSGGGSSGTAIKTTHMGVDARGNSIVRVQHDGMDRVHIREKGTNKFLGYQSVTR